MGLYRKYIKAVHLTYLPAFRRMELAPFFTIGERGCQGIIGPLPSAFLDKLVIRTAAKVGAG